MKKATYLLSALALILCTHTLLAQERQYRPGGEKFAAVWDQFYVGDHEPELDDPLIAAGKAMTLTICEAVKNKDMQLRRYAISALGFIGDIRALPTLEHILRSSEEIYYFRGDALHAIYRIDRSLGKKHASEFGKDHQYLRMLQENMEKDAAWLTRPTEEN